MLSSSYLNNLKENQALTSLKELFVDLEGFDLIFYRSKEIKYKPNLVS
jgi:hypothetical protein